MPKKIRKKSTTETTPKVTGKSRTARTKAETVTKPAPRQKDQFGFMEGTDSSIAAHALAAGGDDRVAIYDIIRDQIESNTDAGLQTRNGTEKNIPNLVATVVKQMRNRGWIVESTWKMVKDPNFIESEEAEEIDESEPEAEEPAEKPKAAPKKARKVRRGSKLG